ncbi:MAG: hypothetical protein HKL80_06305 [Acidimicrobiales bacterium]|nr:hypothetical protein [Acidimicrobiales bacterium]
MSETNDANFTPARKQFEVGDKVEVKDHFEGSWARGYEVTEVDLSSGNLTVARSSDHSVLPKRFLLDEVRKEKRRSMWWV